MKTKQKLSLKIRLLIGIIAIPSLILAAMTLSMFINQTEGSISYFEVVYSLVGVFAMYVALTGKKFF
jgi:high-affinity nickel permease